MNKEQVNGTANDFAGILQEAAGKLMGSKEQQARGLYRQAAGNAEIAIGNAKKDVKVRPQASVNAKKTVLRSV
jgi:uncharacterized protein YjbJ (UPF0337 family)